ncbi:MAG: RNA 2',3'-cyclic phosphodiesterase [Pyrinomonadaceae bacterium]|nr:RNA 2',3'-cyclic phosphodiesterase [Phycisphaerales bacterium]
MAATPGIQRLFVAAYPPPDVACRMIELLGRLDLPPHTVTSVEQIHMTLQFIGDTASRRMDEVTESVQRSTAGVARFAVEPASILTLPQKGPSRLAALETGGPPGLIEIHRRLVHRLARNPREESAQQFLPHFTLARFKAGATCPAMKVPVDLSPFEVAEVRLMRSKLRAGGAVHEVVAAFALGA